MEGGSGARGLTSSDLPRAASRQESRGLAWLPACTLLTLLCIPAMQMNKPGKQSAANDDGWQWRK
jgi:hypothetical protein